jgi:hypothetical protein
MEAVGITGVSGFSSRANEMTRVFLTKLSKISSNIVIVDTDNKLEEKTLRAPHKDIKSYVCLANGCKSIFLLEYKIKQHCEKVHDIWDFYQKEGREFSIVYQQIRVYYCHICQNGVEFKSIRKFQLHLENLHQLTNVVFKEGNLLYYKKNPTNAPVIKKCNTCYKDFDTAADRKDHLNNFNHNDYFQCYYPDCTQTFSTYMAVNMHYRKFHSEIIRYTPHQFCMAYHLYKEMQEVQNNTSATNTTTNNMDSTRKRSHSPATHEEESNAKKAMFNPSESGYPQSAPASENIDDKELLELARELAENNSDFQYSLEKDVADKYATSRDSYLQFSITPKKVYDENVTFSSWGDDYMNDTLAGN